jgi:hypothetical protein
MKKVKIKETHKNPKKMKTKTEIKRRLTNKRMNYVQLYTCLIWVISFG